jgi:ATP-dependent RNA helicase DDX56/DBP9
MSFQLEEQSWMQRDFGLDRRLIKALSKLSVVYPTLVQAKTVPLALTGKDVLVRAKTGSGKTIAFALPVLHKLLTMYINGSAPSIKCIILAPTKELCKQIEKNVSDLIYYCKDHISLCSLSDDNTVVQQYRLQSKPDIVISTPARIVHHLKAKTLDLSAVLMLVIDEADLILSFGYSEDIQFITTKLPKIVQGLLMSATLSPELDKFKKIVLNNPAILKLEETKGVGHLLQFHLEISESDKFLVLYVFLKLGLLQV